MSFNANNASNTGGVLSRGSNHRAQSDLRSGGRMAMAQNNSNYLQEGLYNGPQSMQNSAVKPPLNVAMNNTAISNSMK